MNTAISISFVRSALTQGYKGKGEGMKKFILVLVLAFVAMGVYAQEIKDASSIAYMDLSEGKVLSTVEGGDGYYSRIRISDKGSVVFYYVQMEDNKIIWAYTELGSMANLKDIGDSKYSYTVNGNKYIQGFMTLDDGTVLMWINNTEMGTEGMSFIYSVD